MDFEKDKLYYKDQYIKEFYSNVKNIYKQEDKYYVILEQTAFFPGGGGQWCDLGYIDGIKVIEVTEEDNVIIHILLEEPERLENVHCIINWSRRFDGMQQHLAQHVLSGCFYTLFNSNTAGIHLGKEISTVDIVGNISNDQIIKVEEKANEIIYENHKVNFQFKNRREAKTMGLRRDLQTKDSEIRIVEIEDLDINACCGVHPSNTLEIQMIKIIGHCPHKGNTRIEFLAGDRAIKYTLMRDNVLKEICNSFNAGADEVTKSIKNLSDSNKKLREENNKLNDKLSKYEMEELINSKIEVNGVNIISRIYEEKEIRYLTKLLKKIVINDNFIVLFALKNEDKCNLLFAESENINNVHMGELLKDTVTLVDGKGGGNKVLAQGAGKNIHNINNAMDYAVRKVKELI